MHTIFITLILGDWKHFVTFTVEKKTSLYAQDWIELVGSCFCLAYLLIVCLFVFIFHWALSLVEILEIFEKSDSGEQSDTEENPEKGSGECFHLPSREWQWDRRGFRWRKKRLLIKFAWEAVTFQYNQVTLKTWRL